MRHISKLVLTLLALAVTLGGTGGAQSAPATSPVVIARGADIVTGDPTVDAYSIMRTIFLNICDPLVVFGPTGQVQPRLAESWTAVDSKTYVFKLRRGVRFHDGSPLTAADVKFTIERIIDPQTKSVMAADYAPSIASVDAVDPLTVRVNLKVPLVPLINLMPYVFIIPKAAFQRMGEKEFARKPVCSGAYRFVEWVPNDRITLEAFPGYWRRAPRIQRVVFRALPDASTRLSALRAGEVDLVEGVSPDQVKLLEALPNLRVAQATSGRILFIFMDTSQEPYTDKRVRQALNYATDWNAIAQGVYAGYARAVPGPILPHLFGYKPVPGYPYNPERAKQLLVEAGHGSGFEAVLESSNGRWLRDKEMVQAVAGYLQQIGIRPSVRVYEYGEYRRRYRAKQVKIGIWGYRDLSRDVDDIGFHYEPDRDVNYWNTPALTRLFVQGREVTDPGRRRQIYGQALDIVNEEAPWIVGVSPDNLYGLSRRFVWRPVPGSDDIELFTAWLR